MYVEFNVDHVKKVEHNICPPLGLAVTIPVKARPVEGRTKGYEVTIYVATSAFNPPGTPPLKEFKEVVDAIVEQLQVREG